MQLGCVSACAARRRARALSTLVVAAAVSAGAALGVLGAGAVTSASAGASSATPTVWLCRPGLTGDPCDFSRGTTAVAGTGAHSAGTIDADPPATGRKFDCFYVYPTVSKQRRRNASLAIQPAETDAAIDQASQFSQVCTVWAPMYDQATLADLEGLSAHHASGALTKAGAVAYASLLKGWDDFLAHDDHGRPIVLIGHSQGAVLLIHLIARQIDDDPGRRSRLVVAILAGGNLQVPTGKTVGATFKHVPLCTSTTQTGCAIAWSSFPSEPPATSLFGRPGQGVSIQGGQTTSADDQVACVNPAALGGGSGALQAYFPAVVETLTPPVSTVWVSFPGLYTGTCESEGGATWLQVTPAAGDARPQVTESSGPDWGYHTWDINLALGNLVTDVAGEEAAWASAHPR